MSATQKLLDLIQMHDLGNQKAAAELTISRNTHQECAKMIPQVVDALIDNGRLDPKFRDKYAAALRDPRAALRALQDVASHRLVEEQGMGTPSTKTASANGPRSGMSEADRNLMRSFNIPVE